MLRVTSGGGVSYRAALEAVLSVFGDRVVAVVVFGSSVYMGRGRDLDVLVVVKGGPSLGERMRMEREVAGAMRARGVAVPDVHVMGLGDLAENLRPGTFLSGLALGYEVLYDRAGVEGMILEFLRELSEGYYVLHNRYGRWNLSHHARVTYLLRRSRSAQGP